jgi:hypothetical protein
MKKLATIALTIALIGVGANAALLNDGGNLQAIIDLETGSVDLVNTTGAPLQFNLYEVRSRAGILDPVRNEGAGTGWKSVGDYLAAFDFATVGAGLGAPAFGFGELSATPNAVTEGAATASAVLQPGLPWSIGNPITPGSTIDVAPGGDFEIVYSIPSDQELYTVTNYDIIGGDDGFEGDSQENPIMPGGDQGPNGEWIFDGVDTTGNNGEGLWFDPPFVSAYRYETDGLSHFTTVMLPSDADDSYIVTWGAGPAEWSVVAAGVPFDFFGDLVDDFKVSGIVANVDAADPLGFPTFLAFDEPLVTFTQVGIPEPATMSLVLLGTIGMVARKRRRN